MLHSEQLKLLCNSDGPAMATVPAPDPGIAGYVIRNFRKNNLPCPESLAVIEKKLVAWNLMLLATLKELRHQAQEQKLTFIPIKGPLLSLQLYGDLLRHSSDLDIFVGPDFAAWKQILFGFGYRSCERYPETFTLASGTAAPLTIDLHTSLINTTRVPERQAFSRELNSRLPENLTEYEGFTVPSLQFYLWYLPCHNLFHHGFTSLKEHLDFIFLDSQFTESPLPVPKAVIRLNRLVIDKWLERQPESSSGIRDHILYYSFLRQPTETNRYLLAWCFIPGIRGKLSYLSRILFPPHAFLTLEYGDGGYPGLLLTHYRKNLMR